MKATFRSGVLRSLLPVFLLSACATAPGGSTLPIAPSVRYVAMGSSFAAGPGITVPADTPSTRCTRSADNYARQLARLRRLELIDVSCGGATTAHLLGPWKELPPQLDALTPDTALATITIGGNDVDYIGYLFMESCKGAVERPDLAEASARCKSRDSQYPPVSAITLPTEAAWSKLADNLGRIAAEVHRRAPRARLIFVDYVNLLPSGTPCPQVPLSPQALSNARGIAERLAKLTDMVARRNQADVLHASELSRDHDACATEPWANGFVARPGVVTPFASYHPNLAGMTGIAAALDRKLGH